MNRKVLMISAGIGTAFLLIIIFVGIVLNNKNRLSDNSENNRTERIEEENNNSSRNIEKYIKDTTEDSTQDSTENTSASDTQQQMTTVDIPDTQTETETQIETQEIQTDIRTEIETEAETEPPTTEQVPETWETTTAVPQTPVIIETPSQQTLPSGQGLNEYVNEVVRIVNEERRTAGLTELVINDRLCQAANQRSEETVQEFSHTRPDGTSCFTILDSYGINYVAVGENIAMGQRTPQEVMNAWMNSQGHRENILKSEYNQIGVGVVSYQGYLYWTQLFIKDNW